MFARPLLIFVALSVAATAQESSKGVVRPPDDPVKFVKEKKLALIVGINDYQEETGLSKLKYAVNDATELAAVLKTYGYETDVLTDSRAIKVTIRKHLDDMLKRIETESGTVLFIFSGHGGQVGKDQFLATYDASADTLDSDGLSVNWIRDRLAASKAPRKVMFLDACRTVVSPGGKDATAPIAPLEKLASARGLRMFISTGPDTRSYEDDQLKHGVFTFYLLDGLKGTAKGENGLITFNSLSDIVTSAVKDRRPDQVPYTDGQSTGDFFLGGEYAKPVPPPPPPPQAAAFNVDLERFNMAKEGRDPDFLEREAALIRDPQLAGLLRERAEAMRSVAPQKPSEIPRTQQIADLRRQADTFFDQKNYPKAFPLYRQLADLGDPWGMFRTGKFYELGYGVAKDDILAADWLRKGAEAGESHAMNNLGFYYVHGTGVPLNYSQSLLWYQKAADAGNDMAMNNLGVLYEDGNGVPRDDSQAVMLYRKSAEAGNGLAMSNLGNMYLNGRGVEKDDAQALQWYRKAADTGNALGMVNLGFMYANGRGVERDDGDAVLWYIKAASAGNAQGMTNLGGMYENGRGVKQDQAAAIRWYQSAAKAGNEGAKAALKRLGK